MTPAEPSSPRSPASIPLAVVALLDTLVLVVFAAVGRREHDSGPIIGVLETAWPFLVGAVVGHLIVRLALRRHPATVASGVLVWVATVVVGMVLRQATGDGTALSFIVVATCFTGFFLVGWRLLARLTPGRSLRRP